MAELAGLSVAANVAQFAVLGLQTVQYLYRAYNKTDGFLQERDDLDTVARSVRSSAEAIKNAPDGIDQELKELVVRAGGAARELEEELRKLQHCAARDGRRAKFEFAWRAFRSRSDIEHLQNRLLPLRDQVTYQLVVKS